MLGATRRDARCGADRVVLVFFARVLLVLRLRGVALALLVFVVRVGMIKVQ